MAKRKWRRSRTRWKRHGGAAKTQRRCWGSATRRYSTKCGNSTWIRLAAGDPRRQWQRIPHPSRRGETTNEGTGKEVFHVTLLEKKLCATNVARYCLRKTWYGLRVTTSGFGIERFIGDGPHVSRLR